MDDLISRQAVIDAVREAQEWFGAKETSEDCSAFEVCEEIIEAINKIPSAEPKTGEWVEEDEYGDLWVCDQCGFASEHRDNYCPNCGAKMVREDGEE